MQSRKIETHRSKSILGTHKKRKQQELQNNVTRKEKEMYLPLTFSHFYYVQSRTHMLYITDITVIRRAICQFITLLFMILKIIKAVAIYGTKLRAV